MREVPPDWDETWKRHRNVVRIVAGVLTAAFLLWLVFRFGLPER